MIKHKADFICDMFYFDIYLQCSFETYLLL